MSTGSGSDQPRSLGVVWFRQDLRLGDNPAWAAAHRECDCVLPLFIDDATPTTTAALGAASRAWLGRSLAALDQSLRASGGQLWVADGDSEAVLGTLLTQLDTALPNGVGLYWNRCYEPLAIERDQRIKKAVSACQPQSFNGALLCEPWEVAKQDGNPYRVYTPFSKQVLQQWQDKAERFAPLPPVATKPLATAADLGDWSTQGQVLLRAYNEGDWLARPDWDVGVMSHWQAGEASAMQQCEAFLAGESRHYKEQRDIPGVDGTSRLSPHLHFGEISPRQILAKLLGRQSPAQLGGGEMTFLKELIWREFAYHLLFHFPDTVDKPFDQRFGKFAWQTEKDDLFLAWQHGQTGIPIVDAGMRQLWVTGWMHNRVRMLVASLLVKNLGFHWRLGEAWFRDCLVDADLASNTMGWQWCAGCGADAAPFFRIFNPTLQGEKFDPEGDYVRHWVPELADVPKRYLHQPREWPEAQSAGLDYPAPIVDLKASRVTALDAYSKVKNA